MVRGAARPSRRRHVKNAGLASLSKQMICAVQQINSGAQESGRGDPTPAVNRAKMRELHPGRAGFDLRRRSNRRMILIQEQNYREDTMRRSFDVVMRIVSSLLGLLMVAMGSIWAMQGLNIGPSAILQGFMVSDIRWTFYGVILALFGIAQIVWTNSRRPAA
jgi:hypothetical protein